MGETIFLTFSAQPFNSMDNIDKKKLEILEEVTDILNKHLPVLNEAMNYVETEAREIPLQAFIEGRDVLHHFNDLINNIKDDTEVKKNLVEMRQHFRRGIVESYQTIYDSKMQYLTETYSEYKNLFKRFEKMFFIYNRNKLIHDKIQNNMSHSAELWIEGRNNKNNDYDNPNFKKSIECFKGAFELLNGLDDNVDTLWNDFNKRSYLSGITIFFLLFFLLLCIL